MHTKPMVNTSEWDTRYLQIAKKVASWSKDPRAKVGAVIVVRNRIIATGFNGFPEHVLDDHRLHNKALKQAMVVHAEENALLSAGEKARGGTLYVFGKPVCARCAASIIQSGITRVVSPAPSKARPDAEQEKHGPGHIDWDEMGRIANEMFAETNVQVHHKCVPDRSTRSGIKNAGLDAPANDIEPPRAPRRGRGKKAQNGANLP